VICINLSVKVFQKRMVKGLHAVEYSETPQLYGVPGGICGVTIVLSRLGSVTT
jgi:hypothetical protein